MRQTDQNWPSIQAKLLLACMAGDLNTIKSLIASGVDINTRIASDSGATLLTDSILYNQKELAIWLIENGADVNLPLPNGRTPLMTVAATDEIGLARKLIEAGADVNKQANNGATALMYAVHYNKLPLAKLLIECGARRNLRDKDGWTFETYALLNGVDISRL